MSLSESLIAEFDELCEKYPAKLAGLIPALHRCQEELGGWLSPEVLEDCAEYFELEPVDVYGVASDIGLGAPTATALSPGRAHALRFIYASEPGVLAMDSAGRVKTQGGSAHLEFEKAAGDRVRPPESVADVVAWVIGSGSDASRVEADLFLLDLSNRIVISS